MFDEPSEGGQEHAVDPAQRAREKAGEFRMHAEICAIFEGQRKFDAGLYFGLDADTAREIQKRMVLLERAKSPESPILPPTSIPDAMALLTYPQTNDLSHNDYHVHRRPGELMIVRWLEGEQVDAFYERLQAHFDAALEESREEERQALEWKKDEKTLAYLAALDSLELKLTDVYLRDAIRKHNLFVLSTLTADELNILYLCDYVMGVPVGEIVGNASAPPDEATEQDKAWFFRLFSLRGAPDGVERMCFFAFLQKTGDTFDLE